MISKEMNGVISRILVLAVLRKKPSYGYEIRQRVSEDSNGLINWTEGMLYPVLHRLERLGWVETRWGKVAGRKRKYYHLLPEGEQQLSKEMDTWYSVTEVLLAFAEED